MEGVQSGTSLGMGELTSGSASFARRLTVCTAAHRDPERLYKAYKAPPTRGAFVPLPVGAAGKQVGVEAGRR